MNNYRWYFMLGTITAIAAAIFMANPAIIESADAQGVQVDTNRKGNVDVKVDRNSDRTDDVRRNGALTEKRSMHRRSFKASELIGLNVRGKAGDDKIGEISDLMIGPDGRVVYAAVSFGGFLGIGDKLFAVPFNAIELVRDADNNRYARIDVTKETLEQKEGFDQEHWPEAPSKSFRMRTTQRTVAEPRR